MSRPLRLLAPEAIDDLLLYRLSRLLAQGGGPVIRLCEGRHGITRREWRLLSLLAQAPGQSPSALAQRAQLDRARTSKAISSLCEKQLILRTTRPGDRRRVVLHLSERGAEIVQALFPEVCAINQQLLAALSPEQVALLDGLLNTLQAQADALPLPADLPKADRHRGKGRPPGSP
ncbi:MarR family transcriptional regulator [Curvibacter sp. HBC61]|uniref:MarR family transcriptional regulator n=1 Tax=Curvibacter cyanobacteriorum TaxID=3026422 RepID=A0ABT5N3M5_9BURK|nr:MarR family transcriptional regulator [Curvibacter sp. HBC61]MDD0840174.1 MarR family transcriptional regulator [Curvibacter sp. HBC61]